MFVENVFDYSFSLVDCNFLFSSAYKFVVINKNENYHKSLMINFIHSNSEFILQHNSYSPSWADYITISNQFTHRMEGIHSLWRQCKYYYTFLYRFSILRRFSHSQLGICISTPMTLGFNFHCCKPSITSWKSIKYLIV